MPYAPMLLLLGYALLLAGPPLILVLDARRGAVDLLTLQNMGLSAVFGAVVLFATIATNT